MEKVVKARVKLLIKSPFWGTLALRLKLKADDTCPTAWTDGRYLAFSPEYLDSLSRDEIIGVVAHEVMHCAMAHQFRRGEREPKRWNYACDMAINPLLRDAGYHLPDGALYDDVDPPRSAEAIYASLPQKEGTDGYPVSCGEVRDATGEDGKGLAPGEAEEQELGWKAATVQAAQLARKAGKLTDGLARLVGELCEPKVPWRVVLRDFVERVAKNDYSWSRPNRRYAQRGIYLPSLHSKEMGPIVVAVDTSGSVDGEVLTGFASELDAINSECRPESMTVLCCDSEIAGVQSFEPYDPVQIDVKGGGGTDYRPAFEYVEEHGLEPSCLVYLTDGECDRFPDAPDYPVLWVLWERPTYYSWEPEFGVTVDM